MGSMWEIMESSFGWVKSKTKKLGYVASPVNMQNLGIRAKTGWLGIRIMCPEWDDMSIRGLLFQ